MYITNYLKLVNNYKKDSNIMHNLQSVYLKEYKNYKVTFNEYIEYLNLTPYKIFSIYNAIYDKLYMNIYLNKIKTLHYYKNNIIVIYIPGIYVRDVPINSEISNERSNEISKNYLKKFLKKLLKIPYNIKYILIVYFILDQKLSNFSELEYIYSLQIQKIIL